MGYTLVISAGRADDPDSDRGGVLILIDDSTHKIKNIEHKQPGFIRVKIEWGNETLDVATVYAPSNHP